jgi:hypothetical protein
MWCHIPEDLNLYQHNCENLKLAQKLVNDENGDLVADSHNLSKWEDHFCQLLNMHTVSNVMQNEIHLRH